MFLLALLVILVIRTLRTILIGRYHYYYISSSIFHNPKFASANPLLTNHYLETRMQFTLMTRLTGA